jgi:predicted DNA-binding protein with PD1-like motif
MPDAGDEAPGCGLGAEAGPVGPRSGRSLIRSIVHPGKPAQERIQGAPASVHRLSLRLAKGLCVNEAVTRALAQAGFESGYVDLAGVSLEPLRYVLPAPSPDSAHAAWYSETYAPPGRAMIKQAGATAGLRDGAPFIHCHGIWQAADGQTYMGHLLPHESFIAEDAEVAAWGVSGARFEVREDTETNFRLFALATQATPSRPGGARGLLCIARPNEDVRLAVAETCNQYGISNAHVRGIGSLVGADFDGGMQVASYATEVLITAGTLQDSERGQHCRLEIALVDMEGRISRGLLAGHNPVCVTFELLIEES